MTDKETLPPDHNKLVKRGKFTYLLLKIAFENKSKLLKNKEKNSQRTKRKKLIVAIKDDEQGYKSASWNDELDLKV